MSLDTNVVSVSHDYLRQLRSLTAALGMYVTTVRRMMAIQLLGDELMVTINEFTLTPSQSTLLDTRTFQTHRPWWVIPLIGEGNPNGKGNFSLSQT